MDLSQRRILLVGGAGFIGHHLALALKARGAEVFIVDGLAVNNYYSVLRSREDDPRAGLYLRIIQERLDLLEERGIPLIVQDARNYHRLSRIFNQLDVDSVIHLAAVSHAGRSNKDPCSTFDHSLRTLENALDNARSPNLRIKQFVYLSSSMVYGNFPDGAVTEETPCEPLGIYGALKFAGEKLVIAYQQVFKLPCTIIRPSALYGPRCISRRVSQVFIENALRGEPVRVSGGGGDRLDFTCVDDLVQGIILALTRPAALNQTFNLTFGQARSIDEVIEILSDLLPDLKVEHEPADALMPQRGTLSIDKARRLLGYDPQVPIETGLERYVRWYQNFLAGPISEPATEPALRVSAPVCLAATR